MCAPADAAALTCDESKTPDGNKAAVDAAADIAYALAVQRAADAASETPDEPGTPAGGSDACPYCGETHDVSTLSGFFISFFHDLLFIIQQITGFFTKW